MYQEEIICRPYYFLAIERRHQFASNYKWYNVTRCRNIIVRP